jgi:ABC-type uncharacterized transport system permease subunit
MEQLLIGSLRAAAPIVLVALGGVFAIRARVYHLGLEGLMLVGAFVSVVVTVWTGSVAFGVLGAVVAAMVLSVLYWVVIGPLRADPIIAGLGLSGLGLGATSFALQALFDGGQTLRAPAGLPRPVSGTGQGLLATASALSVLVWLTPLIAWVCWLVLRRTGWGLRLAAVGDHPFAARSIGVSPSLVRLQALVVCGALTGLGGAELALGGLQLFTQNMTNGRGYIAFVAVVFGANHPIGTALAGLFFGVADGIGVQSQVLFPGLVPSEVVLALPYALTIIAVTISGAARRHRVEEAAGFRELQDAT